MSESLQINTNLNKTEKYNSFVNQCAALIVDETDATANIGNIIAGLKYEFGFFWAGIYLIKEDELVLNIFQGPLACTRIKKGKGVCGTAWAQAMTLVVPDVDQFDGHIACSSLSKSEVVVPLYSANREVIGVLDIDSEFLDFFDEADRIGLEKVAQLINDTLCA